MKNEEVPQKKKKEKNYEWKKGGERGREGKAGGRGVNPKPRTLSWGWVGFHLHSKKSQTRIFWMVPWWVGAGSLKPR
jgi:hypothetical protein